MSDRPPASFPDRPVSQGNDIRDGSRDFDFLFGSWTVVNRRLPRRFFDSDDWDVFTSLAICRPALGGIANVEEITFPDRGFSGLTLRMFDLTTGVWSIRWTSSLRGVVDPPVVGGFSEGEGVFEGDDVDAGRPVRVRFVWDRITPVSARWRQSFSADGGGTWETNWTMDFSRADGFSP